MLDAKLPKATRIEKRVHGFNYVDKTIAGIPCVIYSKKGKIKGFYAMVQVPGDDAPQLDVVTLSNAIANLKKQSNATTSANESLLDSFFGEAGDDDALETAIGAMYSSMMTEESDDDYFASENTYDDIDLGEDDIDNL